MTVPAASGRLSGLGHDAIDGHVMRTGGEPPSDLHGEAHADGHAGIQKREDAVVVAATLPQSTTVSVEAEPGYQQRVQVSWVPLGGTRGRFP